MTSGEMSRFFVLSELITNSSVHCVRYHAAKEARILKSILSGAGIRVEESHERVAGTGIINRYAPRMITAYGAPDQFSMYSKQIGNTVNFYHLKD